MNDWSRIYFRLLPATIALIIITSPATVLPPNKLRSRLHIYSLELGKLSESSDRKNTPEIRTAVNKWTELIEPEYLRTGDDTFLSHGPGPGIEENY